MRESHQCDCAGRMLQAWIASHVGPGGSQVVLKHGKSGQDNEYAHHVMLDFSSLHKMCSYHKLDLMMGVRSFGMRWLAASQGDTYAWSYPYSNVHVHAAMEL